MNDMRDNFAIAAMAGMLVNSEFTRKLANYPQVADSDKDIIVARAAYKMADAMLKMREK